MPSKWQSVTTMLPSDEANVLSVECISPFGWHHSRWIATNSIISFNLLLVLNFCSFQNETTMGVYHLDELHLTIGYYIQNILFDDQRGWGPQTNRRTYTGGEYHNQRNCESGCGWSRLVLDNDWTDVSFDVPPSVHAFECTSQLEVILRMDNYIK